MGNDLIFYRTVLFHDALRLHVSPSRCWYHLTHIPYFYLQLTFTKKTPPRTKWEPIIPDKHNVLETSCDSEDLTTHHSIICFFTCLSGIMAVSLRPAAECFHFTGECLIQPLSTTPLAGNEMVSWWMWSMPISHWWAQGWLWLYRFPDAECDYVWKLSSQQIKWQLKRKRGI